MVKRNERLICTFCSLTKLIFVLFVKDAFDREYNNIFQKVKEQYKEFVNDYDRCPSVTAIMCRRLFAPLEL